MKIRKSFILFFIVTSLCFFISCKHDSVEPEEPDNSEKEEPQKDPKINRFFWGTWQSMADGRLYEINEDCIKKDSVNYYVSFSDESTLEVNELGKFTKQSESVMVNNSIPYFRKGGANLSYKMKLVGFFDESERAASSSSLAGYTVIGKSDTYPSFESVATSDEEGNIELKAPVSGDTETVKVSKGESTVAVVPGITVENNGSNMGTIPISSDGQYSLKVTGTIDESEKDGGYLFYDKEYNITLTITNISEVENNPSWCSIKPKDSSISIISGETEFIISSLQPKLTKTVNLKIKASSSEALIDTELNVEVKNLTTDKTWTDFVPVRFYKGLVPVTIAAINPENNSSAALNGFFIYPDGQSEFFQVGHGTEKTVYVPSFNNTQSYKLAFSGATINGSLSNSTEMAYTVAIGTTEVKPVDISKKDLAQAAVQYGEKVTGNETELKAFPVTDDDFTAYIAINDIDFYSFAADSANAVGLDAIPYDWRAYSDSVSDKITSNGNNYYSFYAHKGITYTISKNDTSSYISVGSSFEGADYIDSSDYGSVVFTPNKDGPVYIKISSYSSLSYTLTVSNDVFLVHLSKLYKEDVYGSISEIYGYNIYSFEAEEGKTYTVSCDSSDVNVSAGSDADNPVEYFVNAFSESHSFTAASKGKKYIKIRREKNSYSSSSFNLSVWGGAEISLKLETSGSDCITLKPDKDPEWTNASVHKTFLIYRFNASYSNNYTVYWASDTVDVMVSASKTADFSSLIWERIDSGYDTGMDISNRSGYVYLKVEPKKTGDSGSFRIKVQRN